MKTADIQNYFEALRYAISVLILSPPLQRDTGLRNRKGGGCEDNSAPIKTYARSRDVALSWRSPISMTGRTPLMYLCTVVLSRSSASRSSTCLTTYGNNARFYWVLARGNFIVLFRELIKNGSVLVKFYRIISKTSNT